MTKFPAFLRPRLAFRQRATGEHPDANLLAAFAEGALPRSERAAMVAHLADCPECRQILALSAAASAPEPESAVSVPKRSPLRWKWMAAATAVVVCTAFAILWRPALFRSSPEPPRTAASNQIASSSPAPPPRVAEPAESKPTKRKARTIRKRQTAARTNETQKAPTPAAPVGQQAEAQPPPPPAVVVAPTEAAAPPHEVVSDNLAAPKPFFSTERKAFAPRYAFGRRARNDGTVWSVEASPNVGAVKKSADGGRTWQIIPVDQTTRFYALSANGSNVWVGGVDGKLFYSGDEGRHWRAVPVSDDGAQLTGAIVRIEAQDEAIRVRTSSGITWSTHDGGQHWQRQ